MTNSAVAAQFRAMADRIERNGGEFGGAFLVVPPGDTPAIDGMMVGTRPDAGTFLAYARSEIEKAGIEYEANARNPNGFNTGRLR